MSRRPVAGRIMIAFSQPSYLRTTMTDMKKRSLIQFAAVSAVAAVALVGCGKKEEPEIGRAHV